MANGSPESTSIWLRPRGEPSLTDVFRTVPSLRVVPVSPYDYTVESSRGNMLGGSCVKFWLDGSPFDAVFPGDVDRMIPPYDIAAIEVYNGSTVPIEFPPSTARVAPVMYDARSEQRKRTAPGASSGPEGRPSGMRASMAST